MEATLDVEVQALFDLQPAALADRWRIFARLQDEAPAYCYGNTVLVTRYTDCLELLLDQTRAASSGPTKGAPAAVLDRLTPSERAMLDDIIDWEERFLTSVNGERHRRLRGLAQRVFSPRGVLEMEATIKDVTVDLLDAITGRQEVDFVSDVAYKLPLAVIAELLDVPLDMREPMHELTERMRVAKTGVTWRMRLPQGLEQAHGAYMAFRELTQALLQRRRGTRTTTVMGNILEALEDGVDKDDLVVLVSLLITAGHRTTTELLSSGLYLFLRDARVWARICGDPSLIENAIEEVLRYQSPAQEVERFAGSDFTFHGTDVHPGDHLSVYIGAANHDPRAFSDPEDFDIERPDARKHLSFGRGPHFCLGSSLTRLEAKIAFEQLAQRHPALELAPGPLEWQPTTRTAALRQLNLVLSQAGGAVTYGGAPTCVKT